MATPKKKPQSRGLVFRNGSIFSPLLGGEIKGTQDLYYKLYRKNTDIKASVTKLQNSVGKDGWYFEKDSERITDEKLTQLFKRFRATKSTIVRDITVSGNVYILPVKNAFGDIIELQTLDPRSMCMIVDKYGTVLKYVQRVGADMERYEPEEIYHLTEIKDPDNESIGLSRVETLIYDVMGDNEAMISNYAFFKNSAIPSSIVIFEDEISDEDYEQAMAELKKQFSGGANNHKVSANTGIKDIRTIGQSNKDMEFVSLRRFTTEKVCASMQVPKTLIGYNDGVNFSTGDNNYRTFVEESVIPLEDLIAEFLTGIIQETHEGVNFFFIDDRNYDRSEKIKEYNDMIDRGLITINEVRGEMGYDAFDVESADKPIIKQGYEFVEDLGTTDLLPNNAI